MGAYFKNDSPSVSLWVTREYVRAAPGGTGEAKCGGNYAGSLVAQAEAIRQGCDQVVFLDAVERRWVEELGGMNVFFVFDDGSVQTPPLDGTILHGVTRDSLLTLARDMGLTVREEPYAIDQWKADAESGRLTEAFACGTAAVVTPIGSVKGVDGEFTIGGQSIGPLTMRLRSALVDIQRGAAPDPYGWTELDLTNGNARASPGRRRRGCRRLRCRRAVPGPSRGRAAVAARCAAADVRHRSRGAAPARSGSAPAWRSSSSSRAIRRRRRRFGRGGIGEVQEEQGAVERLGHRALGVELAVQTGAELGAARPG